MKESEQLALIRRDIDNIAIIPNPTVRVQMSAVYADPYCVGLIKNPHERVQMFAATRHEDVLDHIKEPTDKLLLSVVSVFPSSIRFVQNPSRRVQIRAAYFEPSVLNLIDDPDPQAQWVAVRGSPELAFELNLCESLKRIAARADPSLLIKYETDFDTTSVYESLVRRGTAWRNPYKNHENKHQHDWVSISPDVSQEH